MIVEYLLTAALSSLATFIFTYLMLAQRVTRIETKLDMHLEFHKNEN